jgi:hypothetical protein
VSQDVPPRLASSVLQCVLSDRDREPVMGDLIEEYAFRLRRTTRASARLWYWRQTYRSVIALLWSYGRQRRWGSTVGIALAIYIGVGLVESLADGALSMLLRLDGISTNVLRMVIGLLTLVLGGFVANRVRPGTANVLAAMVLVAVLLLMIALPHSVPLWYQLAFLIFGPVASLAGGAVFPKARRTV